jgi:predicted ATPase
LLEDRRPQSLTGGGTGKTRLAPIGRGAVELFGNGVWFVALRP